MTKIGLLAFSTNTGLGYQTWSFYKHMNPVKTLLADISSLNGVPTHHERYPDARITKGLPSYADIEWLLNGIETLFVCETPLNYRLFSRARELGVKIVLQYNYEFLDYFNRPHLPKPDIFAAPSVWNSENVKALGEVNYLPVPVDHDLPPRKITECRTVFHIAGRQAMHDRNGTKLFIEAALLAKTFKYLIYAQKLDKETKQLIEKAQQEIDLKVIYNTPNAMDMYSVGDVLVLPRRYGGLCLPCNEALSMGIPVVMPDIDPNNSFLEPGWLVPATKTKQFMTRTMIDLYDTDVQALADKILEFKDNNFMEQSNKVATINGKHLSWENLKRYYEEVLA